MWPIHNACEPNPGAASEEPLTRSGEIRLGFANMQTHLMCAAFLPDTERTLGRDIGEGLRPDELAPTGLSALHSKHPLLTTERFYKAETSAVTRVFRNSKYTQLLASSVVCEQCWLLHTFSTRDTLRETVGGTGQRTI